MSTNFPALDNAIATFEGFGKPGTPATVNNNPGNIICGGFATSNGANGCNGSFATFPDATTGAAATDALVTSYANKGATIDDLINSWAPPTAPGNTPAGTQSYVDYVSNKLGVPSSTAVSALQGVGDPSVSNAGGILPSVGGGLLSGLTGTTTSSFSWARVAAFVIGVACIVGGIFLFKEVQSVVVNTTKTLSKAGEAAAVVA